MSRLIPEMESPNLLRADVVGTGVFLAVTLLSLVTQADAVQYLSLAVAALLFLGGSVAWCIGFLRAVGRSRDDEINLAGLFYLTGSAPDDVRRSFLGLWIAQWVIAALSIVVTLVMKDSPPFGVLAPVWGIGLITWWASLHATFPPREDLRRQ